MEEGVARAEREMLVAALARAGGNRTEAAKALGIGVRTLYRKLAAHGMSRTAAKAGNGHGKEEKRT